MSKREPVIYARHSRRRVGLTPEGASLTKQEFRDDCDINVIMDKYATTGILPSYGIGKSPMFGDFSEVGDFHACVNRVADATAKFNQLPAEVRDHFKNDPAELIEAVSDPSRYDELVKLGLVPAQEGSGEPEAAPGGPKADQVEAKDTSST